ncbi:stage II sporulation protein M [Frankia sp. Cr2]|uniref:stage II sporulation protein M n=1 Tax=Frankia sp. Cr2 TaxID=3073932 RepID=UPI002AD51AC1|nr:stage II sporulation protein M [Frankia sp. Cr2]
MDLDAYVSLHRAEWARLEDLVRRAARPRRMSGAELDELVELYQKVATHLSVIRSRYPDPMLVDRLAGTVTRARSAVAGARDPGWHVVGRFFTVTFPAAVYARRGWVFATCAVSLAVALALGLWVVNSPAAYSGLLPQDEVAALCRTEFARYYSENPASSFAAHVWTNNAWVSASAIALGALAGLPTLTVLLVNAGNLGLVGGYMTSCGESSQFFTLILPHGLLELTVVFTAGAVGLRLGWSIIDPGPRRRVEALAAEGRAAVVISLGLAVALAVSGLIEAFVTPSALPAGVRIAIGAAALAVFIGYVWVYGRRAVAVGETGDLEADLSADLAPTV